MHAAGGYTASGMPGDAHIMQQTVQQKRSNTYCQLCWHGFVDHIGYVLCVHVGEGRDIELRHQRNPDVVFDYVRAVQGEWYLLYVCG